MGNIHYDQKDGMGSIPFNQMVDYRGFKCWMFPDMFLKLARRIYIDPKDNYFLLMKNSIRRGKPIGSPYFDATWDNTKQVWEIDGHEGRHRVQAIKELWPTEQIEVHIIPMGGIRARDITPEMLNSFMTGVIAEDDTYVVKPTVKIEHLNKPFNSGQQLSQTSAPPMMESKNQNFNISKMEEQQAVHYILNKLIPDIVKFKNDYSNPFIKGKNLPNELRKTLRKIKHDTNDINGKTSIVYQTKLRGEEPHEFRISKDYDGNLLVWYRGDGTTYKVLTESIIKLKEESNKLSKEQENWLLSHIYKILLSKVVNQYNETVLKKFRIDSKIVSKNLKKIEDVGYKITYGSTILIPNVKKKLNFYFVLTMMSDTPSIIVYTPTNLMGTIYKF